jgi:hypothetical protein
MKTDNQTNAISTTSTSNAPAATTKTGRKNKTRLELKLPAAGIYTIEELCGSNPEFVEITLRVRLKKFVNDGKVLELGTLHMTKGRPKLVCATSPVSEATMKAAVDAGVMFNEKYNIPLLNIKDSVPARAGVTPAPTVTA